jgi:prepilin peptidase CpaA
MILKRVWFENFKQYQTVPAASDFKQADGRLMNIKMMLLSLVLIAAAGVDLRTQRIPNLLTLPAASAAVIYFAIADGAGGFVFSFLGMLTGVSLLIIPYLMGAMGAGDAKLMGVVGAVLGPAGVLHAFLLSAVCGGVYALVLVLVKRNRFQGFFRKKWMDLQLFLMTKKYSLEKKDPSEPRLCYGLAIAVGSVLYMVLDAHGVEFLI